jgi:hypothetical protein
MPAIQAGNLGSGIACNDGASGSGFIMYSSEKTQTRLPAWMAGIVVVVGFGGGGGKGFFTAFVTGVPTGFVLTIFATVLFSFLISFFWTVASAFFGLLNVKFPLFTHCSFL